MSNAFTFTPSDEKSVGFKVIACRAITQSAALFEDKDGGEQNDARANVIKHADTLAVQAAKSSESLEATLDALVKSLSTYAFSILPLASDENKQAFDEFLLSEVANHRGISVQLSLWKNRVKEIAVSLYPLLGSLIPGPRIELIASPGQDFPVGAKTSSTPEGRAITITIDTKKFGSENYFALPYLLSHEFWCHVLANHVPDSRLSLKCWAGCSPNNLWEEGWMDYLQSEFLRYHLAEIVGEEPSVILGSFSRACASYGNERLSQQNGLQKSTGADDAAMFLRFAYANYGFERAWNLFLGMSVSVSLLQCEPMVKRGIADCSRRLLNQPKKAKWGPDAEKEDAELIRSRHFFWERLEKYVDWHKKPVMGVAQAASLLIHIQKGIGSVANN